MQDEGEEEVVRRYKCWKSFVPVLYDWLTNHNLEWPCLTCRWGPLVEQGPRSQQQQLYLSEQTYGQYPNTIVVVNCEIPRPRLATTDSFSQFNEESSSKHIRRWKTIVHPGEVNRIRELPQHNRIVATHTDGPEVYVWNLETQPNRSRAPGAAASKPDMILTGHTDNAEFALALSPSAPLVLSGGKDKLVILWDIREPLSALKPPGRQTVNSGGLPLNHTEVAPLGIFKGHTKTVEDVQFKPSSAYEFCSVGDDQCLIFWDRRHGDRPAMKITGAHDGDIHCVDWNREQEHLILTGSADASVKVFDVRKVSASGHGFHVKKCEAHESAVLSVQWCPTKASVFASAGEDGILNIWDAERLKEDGSDSMKTKPPEGLIFKHAGHRDQIVDFHWDPLDPWMLATVSQDSKGGSTLQIWRVSDLIYRPQDEVLAELQHFER